MYLSLGFLLTWMWFYCFIDRVLKWPSKACGDPLQTGKLFQVAAILLLNAWPTNKALAFNLHSLAEMHQLLWVSTYLSGVHAFSVIWRYCSASHDANVGNVLILLTSGCSTSIVYTKKEFGGYWISWSFRKIWHQQGEEVLQTRGIYEKQKSLIKICFHLVRNLLFFKLICFLWWVWKIAICWEGAVSEN